MCLEILINKVSLALTLVSLYTLSLKFLVHPHSKSVKMVMEGRMNTLTAGT